MLVPARAILIELYNDLILYLARIHHSEGDMAMCQHHAALMLEDESSPLVHIEPYHRTSHYPIHLPPIDSLMFERSPDALSSHAESDAESFVTVSSSSTQSHLGSREEKYSQASDEDVGLRFEGVESHWRDWQAPPGNIQDLHRVTSFERLVEEGSNGTDGEVEGLQEEHKWDEETGLEMLSTEESQRLMTSAESPEKQNGRSKINTPVEDSDTGVWPLHAVTGPHTPVPKWRTLYTYHTASSANMRHMVRYVFSGLILCAVVVVAAVVPDDVSVVWQIAGSSVGMLISVLIPCYVYLRLRRYLHARADWLCWWARSLAALALPFMLLCTAHNMYSLIK
eukprot:gene16155-18441_t